MNEDCPQQLVELTERISALVSSDIELATGVNRLVTKLDQLEKRLEGIENLRTGRIHWPETTP
ncbi:MAG: hypothetical protein OXB98_15085 [Bryobacterales bacterium]|nr:hypothetical protein [Bryobacterales bacterium]